MKEQKIVYTCKGREIFQAGESLGRHCKTNEDLSDLVEEIPFDGQIHTIECPGCGNKAKVFKPAPLDRISEN